MNRLRTVVAATLLATSVACAWLVLVVTTAHAQSYPGGNAGPAGGESGGEPPPDVLGTSFEPGGDLAFTGGQILMLLAVALALIVLGVVARRLSRRRAQA